MNSAIRFHFNRRSLIRIILTAFVGLLLALPASLPLAQGAKKHPFLKNVEEATCLKCHKTVKIPTGLHAALEVSDCMACHEHSPTEDGKAAMGLKNKGKDLCLSCHEDLAARMKKEMPHAALVKGKECLACHEPHRSSNSKLLKEADTKALCLSCHEGIAKALASAHPHAAVEAEGCTACHNPHASDAGKLLKKSPPVLCLSCHDADAALRQKHAGQDISKSDCISCHDPHGSDKAGMLVAASEHPPFMEKMCDSCHAEDGKRPAATPELCTACHDDIGESLRAAVAHPPAAEDCALCHSPHASRERKLLKTPMPDLCAKCHDSSDKTFKEKHGGFTPQNCASCHNPHGSAEGKLLAGAIRHAPFAKGECKACHYGAGAQKKVALLVEGNRLCFRCHADVEAQAHLPVAHAALKKGCTACHNPHLSKEKRLLKDSPSALCGTCHAVNDASFVERHAGANVKDATCVSCHAPHGSGKEKLLSGSVVHPPFAERMCDSCHAGTNEQGKTKFTESGNTLCFACHENIAAESAKKEKHGALEMEGCTACHTPHLGSEAKLLRAPLSEVCGTCHDAADADFRKKHGGFDIGRANCALCHAPHGSDEKTLFRGTHMHKPFAQRLCSGCHRQAEGSTVALSKEGNALCQTCHAGVTAGKEESLLHSAIAKRGCASCHDPHTAPYVKQLRAEGQALCFRCHSDVEKRTKEAFPHGALEADGCATCHASPHAADNPKFLAKTPPALCLDCHDAGDLKAPHQNQPFEGSRCTRCHNPHGASQAKILRPVQHPPFTEKMCDACHAEPKDGRVAFQLDGNALCLGCHTEKEEQMTTMPTVHGAVETAGCAGCHEPHASDWKRLTLKPLPALCLDCHDDVAAHTAKHGAVERWGCMLCHEPHATKDGKLLRDSANALCRACHVEGEFNAARFGALPLDEKEIAGVKKIVLRSDRGHPRANHPVGGSFTLDKGQKTEKSVELSCVACHNPHGGADRRLFAKGGGDEIALCASCHEK